MESAERHRQRRGLVSPWTVERVEWDGARQHVPVYAGPPAGQRVVCPECGRALGAYGYQAERGWHHLDSFQFLTHRHAWPPRVSCPEHGVRHVSLPWAQAGSRFPHRFAVLATDILRATDGKKAAALLRIRWDAAWPLMERAVLRGRAVQGGRSPRPSASTRRPSPRATVPCPGVRPEGRHGRISRRET